MTGTCYNGPNAYANLNYDNWPTEAISSPLLPVYAALVTSTYTPNINTHSVWADVSANECVGSGYSANGMQVSIHNTIATNTEDYIKGREPNWTIPIAVSELKGNPPLAPRYCVYYLLGTVKGYVNPLIAVQDLGAGWSIVPVAGGAQVFAVRENDALLTGGS